MSAFIRKLERQIIGNLNKIARGEATTAELEVSKKIDRLREYDEVAAGEMQVAYIKAVKERRS